jgi:hypothetical protein
MDTESQKKAARDLWTYVLPTTRLCDSHATRTTVALVHSLTRNREAQKVYRKLCAIIDALAKETSGDWSHLEDIIAKYVSPARRRLDGAQRG